MVQGSLASPLVQIYLLWRDNLTTVDVLKMPNQRAECFLHLHECYSALRG